MKNPIFVRAFLLLALIALLHSAAVVLYIYWSVWWFDILMHFLGGAWVGLMALWLFGLPGMRARFRKLKSPLAAVLASAVLVGVVWELFEYATDVTFTAEGYAADTALDLVMDIVGALAAYAYGSALIRNSKKDDAGS